MTTVYLVRHGQSAANLTQTFAGHIDVSLTDLGQQQAVCTAEFLSHVPLTAVYTSDLGRAYDTGCAIAKLHGLAVMQNAELREIFAGAWEGRTYAELEATDLAYHTWIHRIGQATCTDGESVKHLQKRVNNAVAEIVARHPDEVICIVSHGTPIRALTAMLTQTPLEQMHTIPWASNASVTVLEFSSPQEGRIVSADLHEHLKGLVSKLPANV